MMFVDTFKQIAQRRDIEVFMSDALQVGTLQQNMHHGMWHGHQMVIWTNY